MSKKKMMLVGVVFVAVFFWASPAWALDPLVPCGGKDQPLCQTCDVLILAKNISDFILFYLVPGIASLAFISAGFLILLGGGIPGRVQQGQSIFKTTVYGLMIMFLAWLIVNTVLRTVARDNNIAENWWKLECKEPNIPDNIPESEKLAISEAEVVPESIADGEAQIIWKTNKPATSQVDRGGGALTTLDSNKVEAHSVTLNGLISGREYRVTAISVDDTGDRAVSSVIIFRALGGGLTGNQFRFFTDEKLPDAVLGQNYSLQIAMDGGKPPYRLVVRSSGPLPEGLTMTTGGLISGKPTKLYESGNGLMFVIDAQDSSSPPTPLQKSFLIKVMATGSVVTISAVTVPANSITSTTAAVNWSTDKSANTQVEYTNLATGVKRSTAVQSGSRTIHSIALSGLSPNTQYSVQAISVGTTGGFRAVSAPPVVFKTQSSGGGEEALGITTGSLSDAIIGQSYNQTVQASGGKTPYIWSKSGNFPPGLSINSSSGAITGTPSAAGDYDFSVQVQDSNAPSKLTSTRNFTIKVMATGSVVTISAVTVPASSITSTAAAVNWSTDKPANTQVEYTNLATGVKKSTAVQSGSRTIHSIALSGLSPNTQYSVQAISVGTTGGYRAVSAPPVVFKTQSSGTATACGDMALVCSSTARSCPSLVKDPGVPAGESSWAYLIPTAARSIPGVDTNKFLEAIMRIETNGVMDKRSGSVPPSCGLMQIQVATANALRSRCGVTREITCEWLMGNNLRSNETLESVARASICIASEYAISIKNGACYGGQIRDLAAGYNGGGGCNAEVNNDNALAKSVSCSSQSTANPKYETDCSNRATLRYECIWNDLAHTTCNTGFVETRDYAAKFNACYNR